MRSQVNGVKDESLLYGIFLRRAVKSIVTILKSIFHQVVLAQIQLYYVFMQKKTFDNESSVLYKDLET